MRNRELLVKYKFIIVLLTWLSSLMPKKLRIIIFNFLGSWSGKVAIGLRYVLLKSLCKKCGDNVSIHKYVLIFDFKNLEIGNNVSVHPFCYLDATGGISIGSDVSIANHTTILSSEHNYGNGALPIKDQGVSLKATIINDNVWIGTGVRVLAGSKIGTGSIAAAGALVKGELESNYIYAGVPVKKIKQRVD